MSCEPTLEAKFDLLLPSDNAACLVSNPRPPQVNPIFSLDRQSLINVDGLARAQSLYGLAVVDSTRLGPAPAESAIAQRDSPTRDHPKHDRANTNNW